MKRTGLLFALLWVHCVWTKDLGPLVDPTIQNTCAGCQYQTCQRWEAMNCKRGYTMDMCQCCYECALLPNDICGGSQNIFGTCGIGTYCKYMYNKDSFDEERQGIGRCTIIEGAESYVPRGVWVIPAGFNVAPLVPEPSPGTYTPQTQLPGAPWDFESDKAMMPGDQPPLEVEKTDGLYTVMEPNDPSCKPLCSPQLCGENKRAVCSARNRVYSGRGGGNCGEGHKCDHTSCLACDFQVDISYCGQCDPTDMSCLKKFGLCIKSLTRKLKTEPEQYLNDGLKYACSVPSCPNSV